jgi:hypothetical protein
MSVARNADHIFIIWLNAGYLINSVVVDILDVVASNSLFVYINISQRVSKVYFGIFGYNFSNFFLMSLNFTFAYKLFPRYTKNFLYLDLSAAFLLIAFA